MANHKSAIKRHRQSLKRREANRQEKSAVRTVIKKVHALLEQGDKEKAKAVLPEAEKTIAKAASKGLYHQKNASRKVSRLHAAVAKA